MNTFTLPAVALPGDPKEGFLVREFCGLEHEVQTVPVTGLSAPPDRPLFCLRDRDTGRTFAVQRSLQQPDTCFLQVGLKGEEALRLVPDFAAAPKVANEVKFERRDDSSATISNGKWTAEVLLGEWSEPAGGRPFAPGPIRRVQVAGGPFRGGSFLDCREPVRKITVAILEKGPLRVVLEYRASIGESHHYTAQLTFDASLDFIRIDEEFEAGAGDQVVWDFSGADLPAQLHKLDSTAGFSDRRLFYYFDRRHARLACWNQSSQLHDFSDGYVLTFPDAPDAIGCVALAGGNWLGNSLNHLEAWERRWLKGDPASRRAVPPDAKADATSSPEIIPARPATKTEPHFCFEGWIHRGRRSFALVLAPQAALRSPEWNAAPSLEHFESTLDRARYRQQQSLPRRIWIQHGIFPLPAQLEACFEWPEEKPADAIRLAQDPPWKLADAGHQRLPLDIPGRIAATFDFLQTRVFGFWEGSGGAFSNPVVSRPLAARDLPAWEWLVAHGHLTEEQRRHGRAWFVFLAYIFSTETYYPGPASMNLGGEDAPMEPTIAGMANQNFYTDVYNMPGLTAQIFHQHPAAARWREKFTAMWRRQMDYHSYPESGVWEESHTYFQHVIVTVLPTLQRRRDDGVEDGFANPKFHRLVSSLLAMLSPRDAVFGGKRHVIALGDHGVDIAPYLAMYRHLAVDLAPSEPKLAAHFAWVYREMGGEEKLPVSPVELPWQSGYLQGLGYFFRDRDARGESLLVLRSGNSWGHHHHDEGSIHLCAAGRSWIVDSAFSYPQENGERKVRADGQSGWMPRDYYPINYLWQFNRGWITAHATDAAFPYATAYTPVFMAETPGMKWFLVPQPILHWRTVVQLAPGAFLILDRTEGEGLPQSVRFHVPDDAPLALEAAPPEGGSGGSYLRIRSLIGAKAPELRALDRARREPRHAKAFATREVYCDVPGSSLAAFLLVVEEEGASPVAVESSGPSQATLRHADFEARIEADPLKGVVIENLRRKSRLSLEI